MAVLELRDIKKSFGHTVALDGVTLSLERGEVHALIGENGAGKSTLMNIISGAVQPDKGHLELRGKSYAPISQLDSRRNGISLIHQELSLAPDLTVAENIFLGTEGSALRWVDYRTLNAQAHRLLRDFDRSDILPSVPVGRLSTATQQVVEICRAIASKADIVLMDEPTSSLQRSDVAHLFELIRQLRSDGVSIIYISHFLEELREIADRFTVLRDGKSIASGSISDVSDEYLVSQMVGRPVENLFPSRPSITPQARPYLAVENLSAPPELFNASFELNRGEILGIAGLVGAGRTMMVRTIFGLQKAQTGTVTLNGTPTPARGGKPLSRLRKGFGYLSEDRKREGLALSLSTADNMTMTRYSACSKYGWLDLAKQRKQALDLVQKLKIKTNTPDRALQTLSGGNQQKTALARLVYQDADILLLDEPTRGVDIGSRERIYSAIAELAADGKAILMISSYLPELFGMCDRLAVMTRGRLSQTRPISEWTPEQVLKTAISAEGETALLNNDGQ